MITRYSVIFAAQMIEPDENGKWVKYEDHAKAEASIPKIAEELAQQTIQNERLERGSEAARIVELTLAVEGLGEKDALIARQSLYLKSAKERLELHGHSPMCDSRYTTTSTDGQATVNECNCGLDEWMRESGVIHG